MSKIFAPIGIGAAFYATSKKEKRAEVLALVLPTAFTAIMAGITEPFEFTFLFIAPQLFLVHAVLAASLATTLYLFGVVGDIGSGLIAVMSKFIIPLWSNHSATIITWLVIGLIFSAIYFVVFRFMILHFDFKTPGREADDEEVKMYSKADYKEKKASSKAGNGKSSFAKQASEYIDYLGGEDNIVDVNNCATRLRVTVKNPEELAPDSVFKSTGAHGIVRNGKAIQIIVGLDVPQVRDEVDFELENRRANK